MSRCLTNTLTIQLLLTPILYTHPPTDLGTIVQNLITAKYTSVGVFVSDCYRVVDNCNIFYDGDPEGAPLCEKANRLKERMGKTLGQLTQFDQSEKVAKAREKASKSMVIKRPEKEFMRDVMRELRAATYTDKLAKITEKACLHFEKPVDTATFTDYLQFVETPMCLEQVDSKIEAGSCTSNVFDHFRFSRITFLTYPFHFLCRWYARGFRIRHHSHIQEL